MTRNIETRIERLEDALKPKGQLIQYSPEEKRLLKEIARREAQLELKRLRGAITEEEKEALSEQAMKEVAGEMGLMHVLENLMRRIDHE